MAGTWSFTYDEARRLTDIENPDGEIMKLTHDLMGNVTKTEYLTSGANVEFFDDATFDALGRLENVTGAITQTTDFRYDVEDNLIKITNATGEFTDNSFDALNRLYQIVDRQQGVTAMTHNDADQVTQYTDQRSIVTGFTYNGFGEVIQEVSADRGTTIYTYDERGLVESMTDGRGIVSNYGYDEGGRITSRSFPSSLSEDQTFTHDYTGGGSQGGDKIHTITDESGSITRLYADGGYISQEQRIIEGVTYDVDYNFDTYGRLS